MTAQQFVNEWIPQIPDEDRERFECQVENLFAERGRIVLDCRDQLLKQTHPMTHRNGYPSLAVPLATILELPALMGIVGARIGKEAPPQITHEYFKK